MTEAGQAGQNGREAGRSEAGQAHVSTPESTRVSIPAEEPEAHPHPPFIKGGWCASSGALIQEGDIIAARDLRDLLEPARAGDRNAALQLRRAAKWVRRRLEALTPVHQMDAWAADRGLPEGSATILMESGLPLLSLELGWRRAVQTARPAAPSIDQVIEAANAADSAMLVALKAAKTICRQVINQLHLSEIPPVGTVIEVGRRRLELAEVSKAGRLAWRDVRSGERFTSKLTGQLHPAGRSA